MQCVVVTHPSDYVTQVPPEVMISIIQVDSSRAIGYVCMISPLA